MVCMRTYSLLTGEENLKTYLVSKVRLGLRGGLLLSLLSVSRDLKPFRGGISNAV